MDERNPFIDDQTLDRVYHNTKTNRNSSKNSLLNYSEMMMEQYSTKNAQRNQGSMAPPNIVYQVPPGNNTRQMKNSNELSHSNSSLQQNFSQKSS